VVSLDWKWLFIYPDEGVASINQLVAPVGVPLHLRITSATVLNVFFVPRLGSEIYAMNGMTSQLNLQADEPGRYPGLAAHFSGDGFPEMLFDVHVVSPLAFPDWVASTARSDRVMNADSYWKLAQQSLAPEKPTFRLDDPRLFDAIATQKIPPAPGPELTTESAQSHLGAPNVR
jgi:cytochrome o ubiquinol oxidase subunit II